VSTPRTRREALGLLGAAAAGAAGAALAPRSTTAALLQGDRGEPTAGAPALGVPSPVVASLVARGRLRQSVARWCFARTPLETLCAAAADIGLAGIDLLDEADWAVPSRFGLRCAIANGFGSITRGFNRPDHHDELVAAGSAMIPRAAAAGVERIVVFSGNRAGLGDGDGIANCITGLRRLMPLAEQHGVTLCLEMLNSRVDHPDYHADTTAWAAEVARGVNSPHCRLLYDVYHMQVMEGNVIATIRQYADLIAHYHTAGVPGRHELDDEQELNYRRIAQVIADTGFTGYVAHEFLPRRDPLTSLREAAARCTV
jgi:hydroxypyruvate isomerase